nr:MAG TPA: hypothetical protein [Caudoviricetes sp.]
MGNGCLPRQGERPHQKRFETHDDNCKVKILTELI